jgi:hypothetical protein
MPNLRTTITITNPAMISSIAKPMNKVIMLEIGMDEKSAFTSVCISPPVIANKKAGPPAMENPAFV